MRALFLILTITAAAGCLRDTEFKCATSADCTGGTCEATGYCSFADTECTDGRRYGAYSGTYSNQCVTDGMTADGGIDGGDGGTSCPGTFMTLPNAGSHLYKPTSGVADWATQRERCSQDGGYLAIPDDEAELVAIATAAAAAKTWVGINDLANENAFVTVKGSTATYLPWDVTMGEPNNQGEQDCVAANMATPTIATERCSQVYPAICECDP